MRERFLVVSAPLFCAGDECPVVLARFDGDPIKLALTEGVTRQVDAAIDALGRGDFDVALTLAGAAEGIVKREGIHLFSFLRESARANAAYAEPKDWISALNQERDWLKHGGEDEMQIECFDAALMIVRAASKLEVWTPKMEGFRAWLVDNLRAAAI